MGRRGKVTAQEYAVANNLLNGDGKMDACLKAGYSKTYVKNMSAKIVASRGVCQALAELGATIKSNELGDLAKVRLMEDLVKPPETARERLGFIRTGLEVGGHLGGPSELHLHQHNQLPPGAQALLEETFAEIFGKKVIDGGTTIPEGSSGES